MRMVGWVWQLVWTVIYVICVIIVIILKIGFMGLRGIVSYNRIYGI